MAKLVIACLGTQWDMSRATTEKNIFTETAKSLDGSNDVKSLIVEGPVKTQSLFGNGINDSIEATFRAAVKYLEESGDPNPVIVISGFSRGSMAAVKLANLLADQGYSVSDMLLFDPVPGPGHQAWHGARCLPCSVEQAEVLIQRDETKKVLTPYLPTARGLYTNLVTNVLPGCHGASQSVQSREQEKRDPSAAKLARVKYWNMLHRNGGAVRLR